MLADGRFFPLAGIIVCFYSFDLPQFRGVRMAAVVVLFLCFGTASLPLTYLFSFAFSDEMRGLQVQSLGLSICAFAANARAHHCVSCSWKDSIGSRHC